jgi:hypothetical protein
MADSLGRTHEVTPVKRHTSEIAFFILFEKMIKTCLATNFAFYGKKALACNFHKTSRQDRFEADGLYCSIKRQQVRQN